MTDRGFTGHMHNMGSALEDIGLVYMAARWYSPTLDKGYLEFSEVTLTAYSAALPSAALPITAGDTYQFTGQVAGALAAPLG